MRNLKYLISKQDQSQKNFGMVGMGYVVEVINEYEAKMKVAVEALEFYSKINEWGADMDGREFPTPAIVALEKLNQQAGDGK